MELFYYINVNRLLHYEGIVSEPEKGLLACGAHSDYGMITLLATDDEPGLQIYVDGVWKDVPPKKNAFIVNSMLHSISCPMLIITSI